MALNEPIPHTPYKWFCYYMQREEDQVLRLLVKKNWISVSHMQKLKERIDRTGGISTNYITSCLWGNLASFPCLGRKGIHDFANTMRHKGYTTLHEYLGPILWTPWTHKLQKWPYEYELIGCLLMQSLPTDIVYLILRKRSELWFNILAKKDTA